MKSDFITIARVAKTQGRHGEVACDLLTDFPEKFAERKRVFALDARGGRRELQVEDHWPHKGRMVLKIAGVDSMNDAELLLGDEIQIPLEERAQLEPGRAYISDLLGCTVVNTSLEGGGRRGEPSALDLEGAVYDGEPSELDHADALVGVITNVQFDSGDAPLLTVRNGDQEFLVPFAEAYIKDLDIGRKRLEMNLPPGLLEATFGPPAPKQPAADTRPARKERSQSRPGVRQDEAPSAGVKDPGQASEK